MPHHQIDRLRQPIPLPEFFRELLLAVGSQGIEPGHAARFRRLGLGLDPALIFKPVQRGVERALLDLQDIVRNLLDPFGDRPTVHWPGREGLKDEEIEGPLDEIGWFARPLTIYIRCR